MRTCISGTKTLAVMLGLLVVHAGDAGDLDPPPGPIGPTMKTLSEVEPRTPVQSLPDSSTAQHVISEPGSYYLTGNITGVAGKDCISVQTENVTLDLNGFSLIGVPGSRNGVSVLSVQSVIRHGSVVDWGESGVEASGAESTRFENLLVSGNGAKGLVAGRNSVVVRCTVRNNSSTGISTCSGCTVTQCTARANGYGLSVGPGTTVVGCAARENLSAGIGANENATIQDCTATQNGDYGIIAGFGATISNCTAAHNGDAGIFVVAAATTNGATINNCTARSNVGDGISAGNGTSVIGCTVALNGGRGIYASETCSVHGCNASLNNSAGIEVGSGCRIIGNSCTNQLSGAGIRVTDGRNRLEANQIGGNACGILVAGSGNLIIKNTAGGNTANYDIGAGNAYGPIVIVAGVGDVSETPNADHPWANFEY